MQAFEFSPSNHQQSKLSRWIPRGERVYLHGLSIDGGLFYYGSGLSDITGDDIEASLIDPSLSVDLKSPDLRGNHMGYYPRFSQIYERCRGAYLLWLAGGRCDPNAYIGYVFLYFYGLERRLLIDSQRQEISKAEREEICAEVDRLISIYHRHTSFCRYAKALLETNWALYGEEEFLSDQELLTNKGFTQIFKILLARRAQAEEPIPAYLARIWVSGHPQFRLGIPARRCPDEFSKLFSTRYHDNYGEGMVVKPNKAKLKLSYNPASPSLRHYSYSGNPFAKQSLDLPDFDLPDVSKLKTPVTKLYELAQSCSNELEEFSRYVGRYGNKHRNIAGIALLPPPLQEMVDMPELKELKIRLANLTASGSGVIGMDEVMFYWDDITQQQLREKLCDSVPRLFAHCGYGVAPNYQRHRIKPELDDNLVVYPLQHPLPGLSPAYQITISTLQLAVMLYCWDDFEAAIDEIEFMESLIHEQATLTADERDSCLAFLKWCLLKPVVMAGLQERLHHMDLSDKQVIAKALVELVKRNNNIQNRQIELLQMAYGFLGIEKEQVFSELHLSAVVGSQPTQNPSGHDSKTINFDAALVEQLQSETHQVQDLLSSIFTDGSPATDERDEVADEPACATLPLQELDEPYRTLFNHLITQEEWERERVQSHCSELGVMLDGALEVINEWAFEKFDAPLIEDGDTLFIDRDLVTEINNE